MEAGVVTVNVSRCCYCGACVGVCPRDALELREISIFVDKNRCNYCGICVKFCPVGALRK